ncbi:MAG: hypothetical protein RL721_1355 [Candidatus Eisenbacteria bacterium]
MSSVLESTATPTAERSDGVRPVRCSTASMSWIMRSPTTSMSSDLGWKAAMRWASMNLGALTNGRAASSAGLKRSTCPTCRTRPARSAAEIMASHSETVTAMGFSTSTWHPAESACWAASRWCTVGTATETASHSASMASGVSNTRPPNWATTAAARSRERSYTPTKRDSGMLP